MENHPIPQDVTGFQFKLIGNMTIKQFGYVAFGVIMAVILFYAPIHFLLKIILIPLFGSSGIVIAFLPIEGRPIDVLVGNFLKAITAPNQYVYNKTNRQFSFATLSSAKITSPTVQTTQKTSPAKINKQEQLQQILQSTKHATTKLDEKESTFLNSFTQPAVVPTMAPSQPPAPPQQAMQLSNVTNQAQSITQQETKLTQELAAAKKGDAGGPKVDQLERQVQALHFQRQQLEQQLQTLQAQLTTQRTPQDRVHNIPKEMIKSAGLPYVSDTPNVVVGIVRDSRGNVLPGMLVEVKDKENNPVRAFKTNQLGQFVSATPLATGVYTIELEDPKKQHSFDVIQIAANNQILLPIEIISHDAREELRKQLFN